MSQVCDQRYINPQTGPFSIEGAEPGDTLAVHFLSIEPREARGSSSTVPFSGSLTATPTTAMLHPALEERTWVTSWTGSTGWCGTRRWTRRSRWTSRWTRCTARSGSPRRSGRCARRSPRAAGAAGALLSLGDGHARQGEGETCGVAVECAMDTVRWTAQLLDLSELDAHQLVSQVPLTPVADVVDTNDTVVAELPEVVLPGVPAMGGTHARLRTLAG